VHKNIYIYLPPQEPEASFEQQNLVAPTPQLHYKIIFIKAPSYEQQLRQQAAAAAANQEKTLVYVLSKRPDDIADLATPTPEEYKPEKPEVYFIKYRTKAVANEAQAQSQEQGQFNVPAPVYGAPGFGQDPRSASSATTASSSATLEAFRGPVSIALPSINPPPAF
jgi:Domain of unknown function (DUF243)